jgi:hypothetical protein
VILNVWVVSALFLAAVGGVLAVGAAVTALRSLAGRDAEAASDRAHLLALIVAVLALVRAVAWPHFYLLLESFVPALAPYGAMCTLGVTRVQPGMVLALQWLKPVVLALLAGWWILTLVDQHAEAAPFQRLRALAIVPIALLALAECATEATYLASDKLGRPVTCCSQPDDLSGRAIASERSPLALAGFAAPEQTLAAYGLLNAAVVALALLWSRDSGAPRAPARGTWAGVVAPFALAALALVNLVVAQWTWLDAVAPRVLGLPYHHCIYEVVTRAPAMGLAAVLTIAGNLAAVGAPLLLTARRRAPAAVDLLARRLLRGSAGALLSALLVVAIHLI